MPVRAEAQEELDRVSCMKPESYEPVGNYDKHLTPVTVPSIQPSINFLDDPVK